MANRKGLKKKWKFSALLSLFLAVTVLAGSLLPAGFEVQAAKQTEESGKAGTKAEAAPGSPFQHPGLLHTQKGFEKMKQNIDQNVQPNRQTWDALWWDGFSNPNWQPRPLEVVTRGGKDNMGQFRVDIRRAYQNALIWKISGDEAHGEAACRIMNAWTSTMKQLGGNADRFLAAGLQGYELANIGEIMRDHPGFDTEGLKNLLLNIFYPMNDDFMIRHNDAYIGNYWANWELANLASMISIGVYCDREDIYQRALNYFKTGKGNGSFYHTMPYVFEDENLVQWQESVRDQGHTTLGLILCGVICETAWNQGDDLYSLSDNRFMKATEYVAKYNSLGEEVPSSWYEYRKGKKPDIVWYIGNTNYQRGNWRPIYHQMYNHYVNRKGEKMPNVGRMISGEGYIEGAPGNSLDELGWYGVTYANLDTRVEDVPVEGELTDGVYRIVSVASGKSLVVNQAGNLASAKKGSRKDEWWLVKNKGDGEYTLTNVATGKVMQINDEGTGIRRIDNVDYTYSAYYLNGTQIGTGEADGSLKQSFAFLPENDGSFRIVPSLNYYVLALENNSHEDNARIVQWFNDAGGAYWNSNNGAQRFRAEKATEITTAFDFDDDESGFRTEYASLKGDCSLRTHGTGRALSLDGSSEFQTVTTISGKSILAGESRFTVSFEIRPEKRNKNWAFFAAPDSEDQRQEQATYLGVKEENGTVTVESCKQGELSSVSADVSGEVASGSWYHVAAVFSETETILYINGKEMARGTRAYTICDLLDEDSMMQIGKANLEGGQYFKGALDNFQVTGHEMTEGEILAQAAEFAEGSLPETLIDFTFDDVDTGFIGGASYARGAYSLVDHDGGKALYLNGWRDYLNVLGKDGGSVVSGGLLKEMTVSVQVKKEGGTGWILYAAPNGVSPVYGQEQYIGIMDSNGTITAQRFKNRGQRPASAESPGRADSWHHIAIVFTQSKTLIYDNGDLKASQESDIPLYEILGGSSIWQIGKANWQTGEYFQGLIDNFKVVSRAWSAEEVKREALKYVDKSLLQNAIEKQKAEEQEKYSQERWDAYQDALQKAQSVLEDEEAKQSAVDPAAEALNKVQAWMRMDEALYDAIENEHQAEYTAKTWEPYEAALVRAREVNENLDASNNELEKAAQSLRDAHNALRRKDDSIQDAIAKINAIGNPSLTPDCSRKTILARQACDGLNEEELALVTNLASLEEAEEAMADYLAEFTFEDEDTGLIGGQAVARGKYALRNGALYLDGGKWLDIKKGDGSSLLTGREALTISFAAYPESGNSNWYFFAAPNEEAQEINKENYLGILGFEETITAERYKNDGERPASAQATGIKASGWIYVTLVCTETENIIYVNGEEKTRQESDILISQILGDNSVLQIGKANWNTGEYYKGYLDNYKILGTVMEPEQIKAEAEAYLKNAIDVMKIDETIDKINAIGLVEATVDARTKITQARESYDSLSEKEKALIPNLELLVEAEEVFQDKTEDAEAMLAEFTFDDQENGFKSPGVIAQANGAPVLVDDPERQGKVLSLDGSENSWLNVAREDGTPLLTGAEEITVSYYSQSKAGENETNWTFFAAPNADAQNLNHEYYLGILEKNGAVSAERFLNGRQNVPSAAYEAGWNHIVVVYHADNTRIYVNGEEKATVANSSSLKEILGDSSILQIGKGNWGTGEFCKALLDDFAVYNYAFTEREVKILEGLIPDPQPIKDLIKEAKVVNEKYYTQESYALLQSAIKTARKAVDTVTTEAQITEAKTALRAAMDALERKPLNTDELAEKIREAKTIKQDGYSVASYEALQTAIEEAEKAMESALIQEEIDAALSALQGAVDGLIVLDKEALSEKIKEAKEISKGNYTEESFDKLQQAIAKAEGVLADAASQVELDLEVSALQAAIADLKEKEPGNDPGNPGNPGNPENPGDSKEEKILVENITVSPSEKSLVVGEKFSISVTIAPKSASNQEVAISSSNPAVAKVSGKTILAVGDGRAVLTVKAMDGSGKQASLQVKVSLGAVSSIKAAQQNTSKNVKVTIGKVAGAAGYDVYRSTKAAGGYQKIGTTASGSFVDKKAAASKTYYYKAAAKSKTSGCDGAISVCSAKIKVLARPVVKAKASKGRKITVSWKKIKGASGYTVYSSTKKTKGFRKVKTIKKAKTVKAILKAKKNVKKLYVMVRPYYKENGRNVYGAYSKTILVKVKK